MKLKYKKSIYCNEDVNSVFYDIKNNEIIILKYFLVGYRKALYEFCYDFEGMFECIKIVDEKEFNNNLFFLGKL